MRDLLVLTIALCTMALASMAAAEPKGKAVSRPVFMGPTQDIERIQLDCPPPLVPGEISAQFYDGGPTKLAKPTYSVERLSANSVNLTFNKTEQHIAQGTATVYCVDASTGIIVNQTAAVPAGGSRTSLATCPAGQVPSASPTNVDNQQLVTNYNVYLFPPGFIYLDNMPDGTAGPPSGIEVSVKSNASGTLMLQVNSVCIPSTGLQTLIGSAPTNPGAPFSFFVPIPDGFEFVSLTRVAGLYGEFAGITAWGADGSVSSHLPFTGASSAQAAVRGIFADGVDKRPSGSKSSARAYVGVLIAPSAAVPPAATVIGVVEFYNQALDHYFITGVPKEISDLDTGVHKGWARTGKSFKAYGVGSTGRTGRRPVCRAYGNPAAGLDSHFYSASPQECLATLVNFGTNWLLEASEVFQMDLPDTTTGACPAGGVPVYRVWNNRADSNHRYTTSIADRDAMVAKGYIKEGYGPNSVTLCALQ